MTAATPRTGTRDREGYRMCARLSRKVALKVPEGDASLQDARLPLEAECLSRFSGQINIMFIIRSVEWLRYTVSCVDIIDFKLRPLYTV